LIKTASYHREAQKRHGGSAGKSKDLFLSGFLHHRSGEVCVANSKDLCLYRLNQRRFRSIGNQRDLVCHGSACDLASFAGNQAVEKAILDIKAQ
jgi:hypothetical protein